MIKFFEIEQGGVFKTVREILFPRDLNQIQSKTILQY